MGTEVGAAPLWAGFNGFLTSTLLREAAGLTTQIKGETIPTDKPGTLSMTVRVPAGVVRLSPVGVQRLRRSLRQRASILMRRRWAQKGPATAAVAQDLNRPGVPVDPDAHPVPERRCTRLRPGDAR